MTQRLPPGWNAGNAVSPVMHRYGGSRARQKLTSASGGNYSEFLMKMRRAVSATAAIVLMLGAATVLSAQSQVVDLWPGVAPGSEHWTQKEAEYSAGPGKDIRNVVKPTITVYLPPAGTGAGSAVVVAPGGAFTHLAWENEGTKVAEWLQSHGTAAFLLKYRLVDTGTDQEFAQAQAELTKALPSGKRPAAPMRGGIPAMDNPVVHMSVADSLKAIEAVRARAAEWHIDPNKLGIVGFSAGGWAAVMTGIDHTAANRPDFIAAIYPCCLNPNEAVNAGNLKVPADAPPLFLLNAGDDPISASTPTLYMTWRTAKLPAELHTFVAGGHGFGMAPHNRPTDDWIRLFGDWLRYEKF